MIAVELQDGKTAYTPGEVVQGTVSWDLPKAPRALEVRLFWYTEGKGTRDAGVVASLRMAQPGVRGDGRPFRFVLPREPWTFSGTLISLVWAIEAVFEPGDQSAAAEIVVAPGGAEVRLPRVEEGSGDGVQRPRARADA